jgi:hypothetical protein
MSGSVPAGSAVPASSVPAGSAVAAGSAVVAGSELARENTLARAVPALAGTVGKISSLKQKVFRVDNENANFGTPSRGIGVRRDVHPSWRMSVLGIKWASGHCGGSLPS